MPNFIDFLPFKLPANVVAPYRVESTTYVDYALKVYVGRRSPMLSLARLTMHNNGDISLVKTRFLTQRVQELAWQAVVRELGGPDDLPIDSLTVSIIESENSNVACD